jgi:hypothetical protein
MKGALFQKPFEFSVEIEGESWHQGQTLTGTLRARSHGSAEELLEGVRVALACGDLSAVRKKDEGAFEILDSLLLESGRRLPPGGEETLPWSFPLDRNCVVTSSRESLYILYGRGESAPKLGALQLIVGPDPVLLELVKVFQIGHRFVVKSARSVKGRVEFKLAPPATRAFGALEQCTLSCRFEGERLEARYIFQLKRIDPETGALILKKEKMEFDQSFGPEQYLTPGGRLASERFEASVKEVFLQAGVGQLL